MYKTHTHAWSLSIVLAIALEVTSLSGQVSLQNRTPLDIQEGAQLLISRSGDIVGYWTDHEISLGLTTLKYENERLLKVFTITSYGIQQFVIITAKQPVQFSSQVLAISVLTGEGKDVYSWLIDVPWDYAFPSVIPVKGGDRIVIADPQSQKVSLTGKNINYSLFQETDWSHEKVLAAAPSSPTHVYLAGMKSAALDESDNVVLFSWNLDESPVEITELPLSILRDISITTDGFAAVSGTVTTGQEYHQKPRLILLSLKDLIFKSYEILPKEMMWVDEKLFAADSRRLIVLQPSSDKPVMEYQFPSRVIPLELFTAGSGFHLMYAKDSRYIEGKILLGKVGIYSVDLQTLVHAEISVSQDYHKIVKFLPVEDGKFFLQLDGELLEFSAE